eukprot:UN04795
MEFTEFNSFSINPDLPSIFLMGARQGGKTSIERVIFGKMEPHNTLHKVKPSSEIIHRIVNRNELVHFQMIDFPDSYHFPDDMPEFKPQRFQHCTVVVFVIDAT